MMADGVHLIACAIQKTRQKHQQAWHKPRPTLDMVLKIWGTFAVDHQIG